MAKRKVKRVKRKVRHVHIPGRETASERQMRTAVQFIMQNPYYTQILKAIRQGVPNSKIAEHFIDRGAFDVNQKTAVGYLQYFRKAQPGLCRPQVIDENSRAATPNDYLDRIFDGNMVIMDEETELLRLIAIQKARLGMGFANEREIQVLMESNRKEVEELRNLIMDLAKLRGLVGNKMDVNLHGYSDNVRDDLKGIQQDEGQRNLIATLVADLASASA
jgi:hypothetical protein